MLKCNACEERKVESEFYKNKCRKSGHDHYCKECRKEYNKQPNQILKNREVVRKYGQSKKGKKHIIEYRQRESSKENAIKYRQKHKLEHWCRNTLTTQISLGKIKKRNICEICYDSPTECHHDDYTKPYEYIELCIKCHNHLHHALPTYQPQKPN